MEEELRVIVSTPSGNDCPRPGVVPFDANSFYFARSTPVEGASPCRTSPSLASVAHDDVQLPLPRPSPPDAAQEAAAAAISITSNGGMPGWLGELYLRLGPAVVFISLRQRCKCQTQVQPGFPHHGNGGLGFSCIALGAKGRSPLAS